MIIHPYPHVTSLGYQLCTVVAAEISMLGLTATPVSVLHIVWEFGLGIFVVVFTHVSDKITP